MVDLGHEVEQVLVLGQWVPQQRLVGGGDLAVGCQVLLEFLLGPEGLEGQLVVLKRGLSSKRLLNLMT